MKIQWKVLIASMAVSLGTGLLSVFLTPNMQETYVQLDRPPFAPPGWTFPVVWTILFVLMGLAAYLAYVPGSERSACALKLYGAALLLNLIWPLLFFRWNAYLPAFLWLLILWYLGYVLRRRFCGISALAGKLMIPYLVWLTFAAYLNLAIALHSL